MMNDESEKMNLLKPGQLNAACEECSVWLAGNGTDSATISSAIDMHRKSAHGGAAFKGSVIYKVDRPLSG